jgi:hypothetical protein
VPAFEPVTVPTVNVDALTFRPTDVPSPIKKILPPPVSEVNVTVACVVSVRSTTTCTKGPVRVVILVAPRSKEIWSAEALPAPRESTKAAARPSFATVRTMDENSSDDAVCTGCPPTNAVICLRRLATLRELTECRRRVKLSKMGAVFMPPARLLHQLKSLLCRKRFLEYGLMSLGDRRSSLVYPARLYTCC